MATLCIDAGTTLIKAVIFDDVGRELYVASRASGVMNPAPHISEQDMDEVWRIVVSVATEAIERTLVRTENAPTHGAINGNRDVRIDRVAVTAQGNGAWIINAKGESARPAILWNDGRAAAEVRDWAASGVLTQAFTHNGSLTSMGLPNAIMAHLAIAEPAALAAGNSVLTCGSWLYFKFTSRIGLHVSDASAPWLDITTGVVSDELIDLFGLSAHRGLVPKVFTEQETSAPISQTVATQLGLDPGIQVVLAPYDIVATATGCGVLDEGEAYAILGTTLCPGTIVNVPRVGGVPSGLNLQTGTLGSFLRAFPTLTGAGALTWAAEILGVENLEDFTTLAGTAPAGSDDILVLPYLSPAGERAPFLNAHTRGVIHGLSFQHNRGHIARAFFESQAHVIRECLDAAGVAPTSLVLSGGGSRSTLWCQIIADVTGVLVTRTRDSQVGAKGAFMYAALADGVVSNLAEARTRFVAQGDFFAPDVTTFDLHSAAHRAFVRLRNNLLVTSWSESSA